MQDEQSFKEAQELFDTINEFIETLEESSDSKNQINGILSLLKTIVELLRSNDETKFHQSKLLDNHSEMLNYAQNTAQILDDSLKAQVKIFSEYDDKISKLAKMVSGIASNSAKLGEQVKELAENTAKIPAINIDNLLNTLNEHADEINVNTASIKKIKDKLNLEYGH
ncbi:hypothetical protein [Maribellus maritimus]|uniref:hypothetical protein n=1 Tax=Maribellus maritimus TaxID=2870838 RepID=UPI001EEAAAF4|nr:hypothetical protein [Maribellus maritimus]MCG6190075.1 hypothetical protein [Maribellus maritimus]